MGLYILEFPLPPCVIKIAIKISHGDLKAGNIFISSGGSCIQLGEREQGKQELKKSGAILRPVSFNSRNGTAEL